NWNDVFENFPIDGLDHQAMEGNLNDESESVAIDGLISLRSQDVHHISKKSSVVDDYDLKLKNNEESSNSFLSTQKVTELMSDIFNTPSGPACVQGVGVPDSMDVD
ncbi:hypothetical protein Tco_0036527, partial [Tanacetum coccineum]